MSKEYLEALNYVWYNYYTEELDQDEVDEIEKNLNVVQDGLKRLESIDNANPSEAMKHLEFICKILKEKGIDIKWLFKNEYTTIKQALLKAQEPKQYVDELKLVEKKLKALEIVKEKRIDIESFYTSFIEGEYDYNFYEIRYGTYGKYCLTEEEFNILKEALK
jgi:hypothetical protein